MSIVTDFADIGRRLAELSKRPGTTNPQCDNCDDSGWEMYGIGYMDPHFRECTKCRNPKGLLCP